MLYVDFSQSTAKNDWSAPNYPEIVAHFVSRLAEERDKRGNLTDVKEVETCEFADTALIEVETVYLFPVSKSVIEDMYVSYAEDKDGMNQVLNATMKRELPTAASMRLKGVKVSESTGNNALMRNKLALALAQNQWFGSEFESNYHKHFDEAKRQAVQTVVDGSDKDILAEAIIDNPELMTKVMALLAQQQ